MDGLQLWHALHENETTRTLFDGIYAVDTLLTSTPEKPKLLLCNTDPSDRPGRHWLLIFMDGGDTAELFDSMGGELEDYDARLRTFLYRHARDIRRALHRVQPMGTDLCGYYCLYYAYMRSRGHSMEAILNTMPEWRTIVRLVCQTYRL